MTISLPALAQPRPVARFFRTPKGLLLVLFAALLALATTALSVTQARRVALVGRRFGFVAHFIDMHADRIDPGLHGVAVYVEYARTARTAPGVAQHIVGERAAIVLGLKAQQVELAHRPAQFGMRRAFFVTMSQKF